MSAYASSVRFRITPLAGPDRTYDLSAFVDAGGPNKTDWTYTQEKTSRQTPNRKTIERHYGWRASAALKLDLATLTDQASIADICSSANMDGAALYLSLDGGVTERQVVFDSNVTIAGLGGSQLAGVDLGTLVFSAVDLIETITPLLSQAFAGDEHLTDGGFQSWGATATYWPASVGAWGTVTQGFGLDTDGSSVVCTRTAAGYLDVSQSGIGFGTIGASQYLLTFLANASQSVGSGLKATLRNVTQNKDFISTTGLWSTPSGAVTLTVNLTTQLQNYSVVIKNFPSTFRESDVYQLFFVFGGSAPPAFTMELDAASIKGPIIAGGVTQW